LKWQFVACDACDVTAAMQRHSNINGSSLPWRCDVADAESILQVDLSQLFYPKCVPQLTQSSELSSSSFRPISTENTERQPCSIN